ncbi:DUF4395 domain-containing protein [Rossellomorea marisflavi]|uniref:DUF4395 domain-containing protein n=1 Tax=Rossellomorea marisflavi TaxID=189381 RepID=UPI002040A010|nr:DUF4395 domain-containing protein [Rossellomorea marisflavi]MCM2604119.1 DUF4395 domain-containing protein [Rossellomorea marisflavi]
MQPKTIPKPLVQLNQWSILFFVLCFWIFHVEHYLLIPLVANACGAFLGFNPIVKAGRAFLRNDASTYIQEDAEQQKFNSTIAVIFLAAGYLSSLAGWSIASVVFTAMVFISAAVALLGFCIGCFIRFQWKRYQYKRSHS